VKLLYIVINFHLVKEATSVKLIIVRNYDSCMLWIFKSLSAQKAIKFPKIWSHYNLACPGLLWWGEKPNMKKVSTYISKILDMPLFIASSICGITYSFKVISLYYYEWTQQACFTGNLVLLRLQSSLREQIIPTVILATILPHISSLYMQWQ